MNHNIKPSIRMQIHIITILLSSLYLDTATMMFIKSHTTTVKKVLLLEPHVMMYVYNPTLSTTSYIKGTV